MSNRFDRQLLAFLDAQAADTVGAPTATEIAARIGGRAQPRFAYSSSRQLVWIALIVLLIVGLLSAAWVGSQLFRQPVLLTTSSTVADLPAGYYEMPAEYTPERLGFEMPVGWQTAEGYVFKGGPRQIIASDVWFATWSELTHVFGDVCDATQLVPAGTTAEEIVSALAKQRGRAVTGPEDAKVAGRTGKVVHLFTRTDLTCTREGPRVWPDPGPDLDGGMLTSAGQTEDVYAFDLPEGRLVMVASYSQNSSVEDRKELEDILASIRFLP